jgi:hypothetical protein
MTQVSAGSGGILRAMARAGSLTSPLRALLLLIAGANCHCSGGSRLRGPFGEGQVSRFESDNIRATAALHARFALGRCTLQAHWTGPPTGDSPLLAPSTVVPEGGHWFVAKWDFVIPVSTQPGLLFVNGTVHCPSHTMALRFEPPFAFAGDPDTFLCRMKPVDGGAEVQIAPQSTALDLVMRPGVLARLRGQQVVDLCTGALLLDLATFGLTPISIYAIGTHSLDELQLASQLATGPTRDGGTVPPADLSSGHLTFHFATPAGSDIVSRLEKDLSRMPGLQRATGYRRLEPGPEVR